VNLVFWKMADFKNCNNTKKMSVSELKPLYANKRFAAFFHIFRY